MRTIEFRAWSKSLKKWIVKRDLEQPKTMSVIPTRDGFKLPNNDFIYPQFTGLLDKNGKKIFEGDILKCVAGKCPYCGTPDSEPIGHKPYPVFWDTIESRFKAENDENYLLPDCWHDSTEIIGNVFEHPELLTP